MKLAQQLALTYIRAKFKLLSSISKKKAARQAFQLFRTPLRRHRQKLPPVFEQAEPVHFKMDSINIKGWRWNHPASKKVLIIHGFESSAARFDRYIKPFIRKGYEVLAFDAPAHGRSGGRTITAPLYKEMIIEVNKQFGPIDAYMAHSFGGLAVSLALEEIAHTSTTKLILIAPATETPTAIDSFFSLLRLNAGVRDEFEKIINAAGGRPSSWYSIRRAMQHIRAGVLWFHDEMDETTPLADALQVKNENHPHVKFVITNGLGHRRIYRENKVTKAIIDFL
jgi:pimeloyl-ACP methyl ester carboxylesterase